MSQRQKLSLIGIWIAIFPFLGIPLSWKQAIAVLTGIGIIYVAYKSHIHTISSTTQEVVNKPLTQ